MNEYNGNSMVTVKGLDVVRKRPGQFIGGTDGNGVRHCFVEIIDNAIDEAISGYCTVINVTFKENGYIVVEDNGRGIPVDINDEAGISAAIMVYTELNSGGKFENKNYKYSGGLHGVGSSVVNALSSHLKLTIKREGKIHFVEFNNGGVVLTGDAPQIIGECPVNETGTKVEYLLDGNHFLGAIQDNDWDIKKEWLATYLKERTSITENLTINLDYKGEQLQFKSINGLCDLLKVPEYEATAKPLMKEPLVHVEEIEYKGSRQKWDGVKGRYATDENGNVLRESYKENIEVRFAFFAQDKISPISPLTFVNNIKTKNHGKHLDGFVLGFSTAVKSYANERLKVPFDVINEDIISGIQVVLLAYAQNVEFKGQTKDQITSPKFLPSTNQIVNEFFSRWLDMYPEQAKAIVEKSLRAAKQREANARAKEQEELVEKGSLSENLTGLLVPCSSRNIQENELFIVEGDSAGGTAKNARDRKTQAILPLRGKILNTYKGDLAKALKNKQIRIIATAIGTGLGEDYNYSKLRFGKIIPLTDADVDGAHIQLLFISFMFKFLPDLIKKGHLFKAKTPLYKLEKKGSRKKVVEYILNDKEFNRLYPDGIPKGWERSRFKGLGEMNPSQLRATAMNKDTRILEQIKFTAKNEAKYSEIFDVLMGDDPSKRLEFIMANINFQE